MFLVPISRSRSNVAIYGWQVCASTSVIVISYGFRGGEPVTACVGRALGDLGFVDEQVETCVRRTDGFSNRRVMVRSGRPRRRNRNIRDWFARHRNQSQGTSPVMSILTVSQTEWLFKSVLAHSRRVKIRPTGRMALRSSTETCY